MPVDNEHQGPLNLPYGTLPPTGKRMDAPCCDVFELVGDARSPDTDDVSSPFVA